MVASARGQGKGDVATRLASPRNNPKMRQCGNDPQLITAATLSCFFMSTAKNQHEQRVVQFRSDLVALGPMEVIRKHITTGKPVALTEDDYFTLRNKVAQKFELHPTAVILVGSCRTGFSIAPKKRYREARAHADLDVALISLERFDG